MKSFVFFNNHEQRINQDCDDREATLAPVSGY